MRMARLTSAASRPRRRAPAAAAASSERLAVLVRERPRRECSAEPRGEIVADDERRDQIAAAALRVLADGQEARQNLHRGLAGDEPQTFAELDRAAGDAVQQRGGARILRRPAARVNGGAGARRRRETLAQLLHLGPLRAGEDHAERIEENELRLMLHRLGDILPLRLRDELRELFDLLSHITPR